MTIKVLLQTTIAPTANDWSIDRFSLLAALLRKERDASGQPAPAIRDDPFTTAISWPNFHSGANGDYQEIEPVEPVHAILRDPSAPNGLIRFLPSHPQRCGLARRSFHHLTHRVLSSAQCLYKRPGSLEIARLKPFRKPSVDRRNQFPTFVAATLLRSKPCKCHRCA